MADCVMFGHTKLAYLKAIIVTIVTKYETGGGRGGEY